ncbi:MULTISPECIES: thioesterase family protein [Nocardiopsis]|uniref:Thioesterase n=1 Tax=Nocardiopsis sinuspersici TaxID=501010 RepID=A0A1V3BZG2_9ACTN|nr:MULTISPECIES: thioesterase family protein [Nocardiopsis]NYH55137.1 acyl-CoA thioesterase [Nocardiopsis sinuspersici]OOC53845.1 thioesterase [Nocardiopsis sinuspersici]
MSLDHTTEGFRFDRDTRVDKRADGEFTATLTDAWNTFTTHPNGGYVLGAALNALRQGLNQPDPLAVSVFFLRPAAPGEATVRTEVVREGRRTATGQALMEQGGKEIVRATATYGDLTPDPKARVLTLEEPPRLPSPEDCFVPPEFDRPEGLGIAHSVEYRYPRRPAWLEGRKDGRPHAEFWMRFADGREPDTHSLASMVDFAPPAVLEIGEFATITVELSVHVRARPAPGWLACRVFTKHVSGGMHEEDMEIWDGTGTLVAQCRQLAMLL